MGCANSAEGPKKDNSAKPPPAPEASHEEHASYLRGPESLAGNPKREPPAEKLRQREASRVKKAMEVYGINDDPDQFDPRDEMPRGLAWSRLVTMVSHWHDHVKMPKPSDPRYDPSGDVTSPDLTDRGTSEGRGTASEFVDDANCDAFSSRTSMGRTARSPVCSPMSGSLEGNLSPRDVDVDDLPSLHLPAADRALASSRITTSVAAVTVEV